MAAKTKYTVMMKKTLLIPTKSTEKARPSRDSKIIDNIIIKVLNVNTIELHNTY